MEIHAQRVGVTGAHGPLLRPTTLRIGPGEFALVAGDPGDGHTALALALSGRLRPSTGSVLLDGRDAPADLRKRVALVDAPDVNEPEAALTLRTVVGEELAMIGRRSGRKAVADWLVEHGADEHADSRFEHVPADLRCALLLELAASRPGVGALVLDSPDRYHGTPETWLALAKAKVTPERSVVVLCSTSSARLLDVPAARLGEDNTPPVEEEDEETQEVQETTA
ncbi:ABC transporter ATP-binding protein [Umezawaea sp. NPDC059074]|uniref:ATP-binding cassette domain-containing protein n=1 Tax=Umezawaea sp. NPDC059074 TaxID=3346716 RepID=UPI00368161EF